jgi:hypothetical protein
MTRRVRSGRANRSLEDGSTRSIDLSRDEGTVDAAGEESLSDQFFEHHLTSRPIDLPQTAGLLERQREARHFVVFTTNALDQGITSDHGNQCSEDAARESVRSLTIGDDVPNLELALSGCTLAQRDHQYPVALASSPSFCPLRHVFAHSGCAYGDGPSADV